MGRLNDQKNAWNVHLNRCATLSRSSENENQQYFRINVWDIPNGSVTLILKTKRSLDKAYNILKQQYIMN